MAKQSSAVEMGKNDVIQGHPVSKLLSVAERAVKDKTQNSQVMDVEAENLVPKLEWSELKVGKVLGRGGFCVVHEIPEITLNDGNTSSGHLGEGRDTDDEHGIHNIVQDRHFMAANCVRQGKDYRYALKVTQDSVKKDAQLFINAVVDLAIEARFLAVIRHPNIIKMRAVASTSPFDDKFFVVLDKLYDILGSRLKTWKKKQPGKLVRMTAGGKRSLKESWAERLTVSYDLSCALKFLHEHHIMYRDLKPDNVGFDVRNDVKIFDFGLAKEVHEQSNENSTFKHTKDTGSPRYMAPEVYLGDPYNEKCDVYSFSILIWQIMKLETPYDGFTGNMMIKSVWKGGARPKPDPVWPVELSTALRKGWNPSIKDRLSMNDMSECLRSLLAKETDEDIEDVIDVSQKSAASLRGFEQ